MCSRYLKLMWRRETDAKSLSNVCYFHQASLCVHYGLKRGGGKKFLGVSFLLVRVIKVICASVGQLSFLNLY